ncbi:GIY-YIG nuclease family protein, partial [Intestinibacter sp.]|uniref:GIY-YIG nuclease family protein n=1 Tax=Intestinibacter sp. TaxID=1965304 RepID=UPI003F182C60
MKRQGIYRILNLKNNKCYYGSSLDLDKRLYEHKRNLRLGQHDNKHLQSSWNKYTEDSFQFDIIEEIPLIEDIDENNKNLRSIETDYIQKYQTYKDTYGYNFIPGGIGTQGLPCSEEKKEKISKANKGRIAHNVGIPMSEEQKQLLKEVKTEKYGKAIDIYTINKVFIETIPSIREASRKYKVGRNTIQDCCNNLTNPIN